MKILVTGGLGFVGRQLITALFAQGHDVLAVDRRHRTSQEEIPLPKQATVKEGIDVSEKAFWDGLPADIDAVMHQAACTDTTVTDEDFMWQQNVTSFENLLSWAERSSASVVYASSAATYGNAPSPQTVGKDEHPLNPYGKSKLAMDEMARERIGYVPFTLIGLRYFNVYGPGERHKAHMASMIHRLAEQVKVGKRPRIFRDGTQARDQVYIDDVVQANMKALVAGREKSSIYNVGTGHAVSFNEIVTALNETLGTSLEPEYFENPYQFYQNHTLADIRSTREQLGYEPQYDIRSGIRAYNQSGLL